MVLLWWAEVSNIKLPEIRTERVYEESVGFYAYADSYSPKESKSIHLGMKIPSSSSFTDDVKTGLTNFRVNKLLLH